MPSVGMMSGLQPESPASQYLRCGDMAGKIRLSKYEKLAIDYLRAREVKLNQADPATGDALDSRASQCGLEAKNIEAGVLHADPASW